MFPLNSSPCGWRLGLEQRSAQPPISGKHSADCVVIGAGFTGLAAARRMAELRPEARVILLDAERAGEGASSRNSGYIVDSTLNDGGRTQSDKAVYLTKYQHNLVGMARLKAQVAQHSIACDWLEVGKIHCAAESHHVARINQFHDFLSELGIEHSLLDQSALEDTLGTNYYQIGVHTTGGVLVNPAALVDGLLDSLPASVELYDASPVLTIEPGRQAKLITPDAVINADQVIVAVNALMPQLGVATKQVFPLTLTASITRSLTDEEFRMIGSPKPWGVLSVHPMGATVRLTSDRRIMIRNTVESTSKLDFSSMAMKTRVVHHRVGLLKRFPSFGELEFQSSWSGNVCISRNTKPIFEEVDSNIFAVGCYNAGGIALGTLYGELMVERILNRASSLLSQVQALDPPNKLPPKALLSVGLKARLAWRRFKGRNEA